MTTQCDDLLEGTPQGNSTKWWKVCYPRTMSCGNLAILATLFIGIIILKHQIDMGAHWTMSSLEKAPNPIQVANATSCEPKSNRHGQQGSEILPRGIVQDTSDLQLRSMWSDPNVEVQQSPSSQSLLAMAVGIKQKEIVDRIVRKFLADNFTVMLFHYDGNHEEWNMVPWSNQVIHIVASNQTKWWFAKRFLHPDVVAPYKYVFVWDEDIGVENFDAGRYLAIVEEEGLEISQPALDPELSVVHTLITVRRRKGRVHRRMYKFKGGGLCFENSTQPPCTGWVEMMVIVFSRAAWRCAWYMIQNDLVHAWGLDLKLGYCAQGDRSRKVGVVDDQYVVHYGIPSLGGHFNKAGSATMKGKGAKTVLASPPVGYQDRAAIRWRSHIELEIFNKKWKVAAQNDKCWVDPY